jgi:cytochrome c oxidase cbb3-type subunit 3
MSEKKPALEDKLLTHSYDGIQEYDNPMPAWWTIVFWATVVWSIFYLIGINVGWIDTYEQDLRASLDDLSRVRSKAAAANPAPEVSPAMLMAAVADKTNLDAGKEVFTGKCAPCHGPEGQGLIGPNLTDKFWIHGGTLSDIHKTIRDGIAAKGMPAWGMVLKPEELMAAFAHVHSLRGTTPANPKPPQGAEYKETAAGDAAAGDKGAEKVAPGADTKAPAGAKEAPGAEGTAPGVDVKTPATEKEKPGGATQTP